MYRKVTAAVLVVLFVVAIVFLAVPPAVILLSGDPCAVRCTDVVDDSAWEQCMLECLQSKKR